MSSKQATEKKSTSKETVLKEITLQLSQALPALKESLGEKKFSKRIKKAAKLLIGGIKSEVPKATAATKLAVGKTNKSKSKATVPVKKTAKAVVAKK